MKLPRVIPLIIAFPAITIGALAMHFYGVKAATYGQNIICFLLAGSISYLIIGRKAVENKHNFYTVVVILIEVMLLLLTFFDPGIQGVHRWVAIGPIRFYVSSMILPGIIIGLWELLRKKNWWPAYFFTFLITLLLTLQPDASQLTAFTFSMIILLIIRSGKEILKSCCAVALILFIAYSWINIDNLPPVAYVENIIQLVGSMGLIWSALGISSLLLLPLPFILFPPRNSKAVSICLGIYFSFVLASTQFGNFPIPLMGYGISPIIGYFISITWLEILKSKDQGRTFNSK